MFTFSLCRIALSWQWTLPLALLLPSWINLSAYRLQQSDAADVQRGQQPAVHQLGLGLGEFEKPFGRTTPETTRPEDRQPVLSKSVSSPLFRPDTVLIYDAIDGTQRYSFGYDGRGNMLTALYEDWNGTHWVNHFRVTTTYDGDENRLTELKEWRNGTRWVMDWRYTFTYDDRGNRLTELREWPGSPLPDWRHTYTYDDSGNSLTASHEVWDGTQWLNAERYTYTYDSGGNRTTELYDRWDGTQWVTRGRYTYAYDGSGNRLTASYEVWNGSQWVKSHLYTYTYDDSGNRLTEIYEGEFLLWNRIALRYTYTYDGSGNMLTSRSERRNGTQWVSIWRYTYTYDGRRNRLTELHEAWDGAQWVNEWRYTYTYNASGNLKLFNSEAWSGSEWVRWSGELRIPILEDFYHDWSLTGHKIALQYTEIATSIESQRDELALAGRLGQNFPNPFSEVTTISYELPQNADVTLTVVDLLGRTVRELVSGTQPSGGYEVSFDAAGLPSGVYFCRLHAGAKVETKRMVVVR